MLAACVALGLTLDSRVSNPAPVIILAIAGAYGAWLVGVVVFGAVRGSEDAGAGGEQRSGDGGGGGEQPGQPGDAGGAAGPRQAGGGARP